MSYVTVTPAYGRDYKSAKAAKADWNADKDFILQDSTSRYNGKPINKADATKAGLTVNIRYGKLRKICKA